MVWYIRKWGVFALVEEGVVCTHGADCLSSNAGHDVLWP